MEMVWDWKSIGSLLATMMFLRTAAHDFIPAEVRQLLSNLLSRLISAVRPTATVIIDEYDTTSGGSNELFDAAQTYLGSRCLSSAAVLRLSKPRQSRLLTPSLPVGHSTFDSFDGGVQLKWSFRSRDRPSNSAASSPFYHRPSSEHRFFELTFHDRHRAAVHSLYIPHVLAEARRLRLKSRERHLYTNRSGSGFNDIGGHGLWSSVPFHHPSTFETLAIDPALRDDIRSDLLRFSGRREYYARVGRAWKRGYLLHGPPGTGKTSLIAAIANFLDFDLYDLELTAVSSNSHLRKLLVSTSTKSVIVVEDVDCSLDLKRTSKPVPLPACTPVDPDADSDSSAATGDSGGGGTAAGSFPVSSVSLSGVLNFVDGLWSSCVGERLMIFTTNHPERLDPALLRPGRMDRRIHLSYCEPLAFRVLVKNYLEVSEHELMPVAEELLKEVRVTPAEVAEVLMGCDGDGTDIGMRKVVEELQRRKEVAAAGEAEEEEEGRTERKC